MNPRLKINEIFYSLQGESTFAGRPCVLVRLTGCQMRCTWCDSAYSFYEGQWMDLEAVMEEVRTVGCPLVEVTGGEPLLQPAVHPLMTRLCDEGYTVLLETGGGLPIQGVDERVHRIVDVKCPASGEDTGNDYQNLKVLTSLDEVKFVLADRRDYEWARTLLREKALDRSCHAVHFSPVDATLDPRELAAWILEDGLPVRFQMQLHKTLWPEADRGV